jgi:hypothetical protein
MEQASGPFCILGWLTAEEARKMKTPTEVVRRTPSEEIVDRAFCAARRLGGRHDPKDLATCPAIGEGVAFGRARSVQD